MFILHILCCLFFSRAQALRWYFSLSIFYTVSIYSMYVHRYIVYIIGGHIDFWRIEMNQNQRPQLLLDCVRSGHTMVTVRYTYTPNALRKCVPFRFIDWFFLLRFALLVFFYSFAERRLHQRICFISIVFHWIPLHFFYYFYSHIFDLVKLSRTANAKHWITRFAV